MRRLVCAFVGRKPEDRLSRDEAQIIQENFSPFPQTYLNRDPGSDSETVHASDWSASRLTESEEPHSLSSAVTTTSRVLSMNNSSSNDDLNSFNLLRKLFLSSYFNSQYVRKLFTLILPLIFCPENVSAYYVCCIYSSALQT